MTVNKKPGLIYAIVSVDLSVTPRVWNLTSYTAGSPEALENYVATGNRAAAEQGSPIFYDIAPFNSIPRPADGSVGKDHS